MPTRTPVAAARRAFRLSNRICSVSLPPFPNASKMGLLPGMMGYLSRTLAWRRGTRATTKCHRLASRARVTTTTTCRCRDRATTRDAAVEWRFYIPIFIFLFRCESFINFPFSIQQRVPVTHLPCIRASCSQCVIDRSAHVSPSHLERNRVSDSLCFDSCLQLLAENARWLIPVLESSQTQPNGRFLACIAQETAKTPGATTVRVVAAARLSVRSITTGPASLSVNNLHASSDTDQQEEECKIKPTPNDGCRLD